MKCSLQICVYFEDCHVKAIDSDTLQNNQIAMLADERPLIFVGPGTSAHISLYINAPFKCNVFGENAELQLCFGWPSIQVQCLHFPKLEQYENGIQSVKI